MSLAQRLFPVDEVQADTEVSPEARERLNSARVRDLSFAIKRRIGEGYGSGDIDMLVSIVLKAASQRQTLTKDLVLKNLRELGRSPQKAEELASALFA
jgi:hypothetical protein